MDNVNVQKFESVTYAIQQRMKFEDKFFKDGVPGDMIYAVDGVETVAAESFAAGMKFSTRIHDSMQLDEWSNNACLGYVLLGLQRQGYSAEETKQIINAIRGEFDFNTIGEATEKYNKSSY